MARNTREHIYNELRNDIMLGRIKSGERLLESDLTKYFSCSRTPVREAIRQLQSEKLVDFISNRGATVARISIQEVEEIFSIRCLLESHAVELAAKRMNKADLDRLIEMQRELEIDASRNDYMRYIDNDAKFHLFFPKICGNTILLQVIKDLRSRLNLYRYLIMTVPGNFTLWINSHRKIINGLTNNDPKLAAKHMERHVEDSKRIAIQLSGYFERF